MRHASPRPRPSRSWLAVMAYDAGILKGAHDPVMKFRAGDPDWGGANWTRDTDPADWMRHSVVWYSQRITRAMGGGCADPLCPGIWLWKCRPLAIPAWVTGLERAWISSSLKISPREQAAFLRSLVLDALPVQRQAMSHARDLAEVHQLGGWQLHGKRAPPIRGGLIAASTMRMAGGGMRVGRSERQTTGCWSLSG